VDIKRVTITVTIDVPNEYKLEHLREYVEDMMGEIRDDASDVLDDLDDHSLYLENAMGAVTYKHELLVDPYMPFCEYCGKHDHHAHCRAHERHDRRCL